MISGCACISFDCPSGPSEIIQHRDNGILVENGNVDAMAKEIQQLCSDERQISALSDKGKELKGKLNTQTIGKQWEYLIQDVVNKSNKL
jgi:glycosyltransferase involved in cell wall biosynthesis